MISKQVRNNLFYIGFLLVAVGLQGCAIFEGVGDALVRACEQPEFNTTKFDDTNDGICTASDCSLREAIITANACEGEDVINLSPGTYTLDLRGASSYPSEYENLVVTEDLILIGNSANVINWGLVVSGDTTRLMLSDTLLHGLWNEGSVDAADLTTGRITNTGEFIGSNIDVIDGGGIINEGAFSITGGNVLRNSARGGIGDRVDIILNQGGSMTLSNLLIADNTVSPEYEGEYPELLVIDNQNGDLRLDNVVIRDNNRPVGIGRRGGGVWNSGGSIRSNALLNRVTISGHDSFAVVNGFADIEINDSAIENNNGGALFNDADGGMTIRRSLLSGNGNSGRLSGACGTVFNFGDMEFENSTIAGSIDIDSGCATIENWDHLSLVSTTIYGNALRALLDQPAGTPATQIARSILAQNGGGNCSSSVVTSAGFNLFDDSTCTPTPTVGDIVDSSGVLGIEDLTDNGGPTRTHALTAVSPAVDAAGDRCLTTDQRGVARPLDGNGDDTAACDIGAYELDPSGSAGASSPETEESTPVPTSTSEPTATPLGPITVNFNADTYALIAGECTRLRWEVNNAETVMLEGVSVPPLEAEQVCPLVTTTYKMVASNTVETVERFVTIEVTKSETPPEAPVQLGITNQVCSGQDYSVTLAWIDVADNEDGYRVYRDGALIGTLGPNAKGFTDNPSYGGPYTYGVEAFNSAGASTRPTAQDAGCII